MELKEKAARGQLLIDFPTNVGRCEILSDDMRLVDIIEVIEGVAWRRDEHCFLMDRGVRNYLLDLLRQHLPRRHKREGIA
jgi:hypothetical protein